MVWGVRWGRVSGGREEGRGLGGWMGGGMRTGGWMVVCGGVDGWVHGRIGG